MRAWLPINLGLTIASVIGGLMASQVPVQSGDLGGIKDFLMLAFVMAGGVVMVGAMMYLLSGGRAARERPSLRRCPFNIRDPMQMIYIGSLAILAQAMGVALAGAGAGAGAENGWLLPLCIGAGGLVGSYVASRIFVDASGARSSNRED